MAGTVISTLHGLLRSSWLQFCNAGTIFILHVRNLRLGDFTNEEPNLTGEKSKKLSDLPKVTEPGSGRSEMLIRLSDCNYPHKMINGITFCMA